MKRLLILVDIVVVSYFGYYLTALIKGLPIDNFTIAIALLICIMESIGLLRKDIKKYMEEK